MSEVTPFSKRLMQRFYLLAGFLFLFALILVGKLIHIQFYENEEGLGLAPETLVKNVVLEPSRGNIYAADGNILATSIPRYELHWDAVTPSDYLFTAQKKALADSIARVVNKAPDQLLRNLEKARRQKTDTGWSLKDFHIPNTNATSPFLYSTKMLTEED